MDSNLGPVVANIYMRFLETLAINSSLDSGLTAPVFWIRYVDGVLALFDDESHVGPFLAHLNS